MLSKITYPLVLIRHKFRKNIAIGKACKISPKSSLDLTHGGNISIGKETSISKGAIISTHGGHVKIGQKCSINPYCILYGHGGLDIGDFVRIAAHTVIVPMNHLFSDPTRPVHTQGISTKGIKINDDVWIGANVTILDGVEVGRGSVIGAGSVVTRNVPEFSVFAGNPAKQISSRINCA